MMTTVRSEAASAAWVPSHDDVKRIPRKRREIRMGGGKATVATAGY
jgi:hypothetical protein